MNKIKEKVLKYLNKIILERVKKMQNYDKNLLNEKTNFFIEKSHIVQIAIKKCFSEVEKVIEKEIKEDIKYQEGKLTRNFNKDKPLKWRIEGMKHLLIRIKRRLSEKKQ